jgi:5-methylcytosine-specific restriction enzyme A
MARPILSISRGDAASQGDAGSGPNAAQNSRFHNSDSRDGQSAKPAWKHERKSRHERGYGTAWDKLRKEVMARDQRLCQPCLRNGLVIAAHAVDHIVQKAAGGTDELTNLQAICRACHIDKTMTDNGRRKRVTIGHDGWPA